MSADEPTPATAITTVVFDFGGVITTSPFEKFAAYEARAGLPVNLIRTINSTSPDTNAWAQLERSAVSQDGFCALFEAEARALGHDVSGAEVLACLVTEIRPMMVTALARVHEHFATAMLTNNFTSFNGSERTSSGASFADVTKHFDHIIESAVVGVRKPDPEIYRVTCETVGAEPHQIAFLDDLGINLKPARQMGMTTIKVVDPVAALRELEAVLGIDLSVEVPAASG